MMEVRTVFSPTKKGYSKVEIKQLNGDSWTAMCHCLGLYKDLNATVITEALKRFYAES